MGQLSIQGCFVKSSSGGPLIALKSLKVDGLAHLKILAKIEITMSILFPDDELCGLTMVCYFESKLYMPNS